MIRFGGSKQLKKAKCHNMKKREWQNTTSVYVLPSIFRRKYNIHDFCLRQKRTSCARIFGSLLFTSPLAVW